MSVCYRAIVQVTVGFAYCVVLAIHAGAQTPDPAAMMQRFDKDSNRELSRDEAPPRLKEMFAQFDEDKSGGVSLEELKRNMAKARGAGRAGRPKTRPGEVVAPAALKERKSEVLKAGDKAPDFQLPMAGSDKEISLSELIRERPAVLVFGSISCSPFRQRIEEVERLYHDYKDKVNFVMIYIREAHPDSVIMVKTAEGGEALQKFTQTDDNELRNQHAETCNRTLKLPFPLLVDTVDNKTNNAYSGWPIRLVIVGTDGRVIDPGAPGPQGFQPDKLQAWLKDLF